MNKAHTVRDPGEGRKAAQRRVLLLSALALTVAGTAVAQTKRPDLSGMYDTATLTPLVRPPQFGDRLVLTAEEAQNITEHWQTNLAKDYAPSDPNREAPPEGGVGIYAPEFTGAAGKVGGYNAFFVDIGDGTFELDGEFRTSIITEPKNGQRPPLSELGQRIHRETEPYRHENTGTAWWMHLGEGPYDDPELRPLQERCLLSRSRSGPPTLPAMYNNLKRVLQTDTHLMILAEQIHDARIIPLNVERDENAPPEWMGQSIGRWEGDTLVVETTNFLETKSDRRTRRDLRVVERFSRMSDEALLYSFTVYDPRHTEPWSGEYPWPATTHKLYEYGCHEGNYSFGGILRGARLLEGEAKAQH